MDSVLILNQDDFGVLLCNSDDVSHRYISQLMRESVRDLVCNVETKIIAMTFDNEVWPLTVNQKEYQNALICSPYTTYITYPLSELKKFKKIWIKSVVLLNTTIMGAVCRLTKFNQVVQVNNYLNSLIKHSKKFVLLMPQITEEIIKKYPQHAITFFRVNDTLDSELLNALQKNGYFVFPDRVAHVFFPEKQFIKRSHSKRDLSLLRHSQYTMVTHDELMPEDGERLAELYRLLFVDKHSKYSPIYTAHYFRQAIYYRWHHYTALRNSEGNIDAFISWFENENILMCGPLGYDAMVDRKMGLYRQLVAMCLQYADSHQLIFNMGGGSDEFKLNRGSTETMEYVAVYCHHLAYYRQIPWKILQWACNKLIKKIMSASNL